MSINRLIAHYAKFQDTFRHYFQLTQERRGMEDIHQLRVNVKRMRAIWSLIQRSSGGHWRMEDHRSLTTPLFKLAGRVRDAQVSLSLIRRRKPKHFLPFIEYLEAQLATAGVELVDALSTFDLAALAQLDEGLIQEMHHLDENWVIHQANDYLQRELVKVKQLTDQLPGLKKLHKIRIRLKAIGEVLRVLKALRFTAQHRELYRDIKQLNKVIGRWHDEVNLLGTLHRFLQAYPKENNPYFAQLNAQLKRKVLDQAEELRQTVQTKFSD